MPPKPFYKHCQHCDKGFSTFEHDKVYCSDPCEVRATRIKQSAENSVDENTRGSFKCLACGYHFIRKRHDAWTNPEYCTASCYFAGERQIRQQNDYDSKRAIQKTCPECNETFITYKNNVKYCTNMCAEKANKEKLEKLNAKRKEDNEKAGKKRKKIPYHVLNLMAEKRRLSEDWDRLTH